jgi:hypothetical protein
MDHIRANELHPRKWIISGQMDYIRATGKSCLRKLRSKDNEINEVKWRLGEAIMKRQRKGKMIRLGEVGGRRGHKTETGEGKDDMAKMTWQK